MCISVNTKQKKMIGRRGSYSHFLRRITDSFLIGIACLSCQLCLSAMHLRWLSLRMVQSAKCHHVSLNSVTLEQGTLIYIISVIKNLRPKRGKSSSSFFYFFRPQIYSSCFHLIRYMLEQSMLSQGRRVVNSASTFVPDYDNTDKYCRKVELTSMTPALKGKHGNFYWISTMCQALRAIYILSVN